MSTRIVLTAAMSERFNELTIDKQAQDALFEKFITRMLYSEARTKESEKALWDEIIEIYNLDPKIVYTAPYDIKERRRIIVEKERIE